MDKNNDIKTDNVSKWETAPKNMGTLITYIELVIGMACSLPNEIHDNLYDLMGKTLDEYNELEAKCKEACDKVSQYEEENRILREQRKTLAEDNENLKDESFKYHYRLDKLGQALEERGIYCRWFEAEMGWHLYEGKTMDDLKQHYEEELRIREKEKDEKDKLIDELNSKIMALKLRTNMMHGYGFYNAQINAQIELNRKIKELEKENKDFKTIQD